ncbi:type II 3-dehydroquinate dehydratase [Rhodospirillaceae bacterium KN72]|uniref:3-dehydroquinate dehydratase n=1 Tax=Pacificispira spongiicola TaxID=2729598 RepID=A0A7Y0E213_9PROT|nr:type II 3-dehydroquinate dehydratase [Pacificispira spongiicola]NMM45782.1 type II 3-dehydroquinate dehydratase [Pacificispira spongiicola]
MPHITVLNGPNLNLLGEREPEIYGATTLPEVEKGCRALAATLGVDIDFFQSNFEGELINWIHAARKSSDAIVINPAGLSFHSIPLLDALKTFDGPIVEVHISNIHARDELHRHSIMSTVASGVICGMGPFGYSLAMLAALRKLGPLPVGLPDGLATLPV